MIKALKKKKRSYLKIEIKKKKKERNMIIINGWIYK